MKTMSKPARPSTRRDYLSTWSERPPKSRGVAEFLQLNPTQMSIALGLSGTPELDEQNMSKNLAAKVEQLADLINRVAELLGGDMNKSVLWFRTPNPMLGEVTPRDMLLMNRYSNLEKFVTEAEDKR